MNRDVKDRIAALEAAHERELLRGQVLDQLRAVTDRIMSVATFSQDWGRVGTFLTSREIRRLRRHLRAAAHRAELAADIAELTRNRAINDSRPEVT